MALFNPSLSPGVTVNEIDLTSVVPNVSTSLTGFVGDFKWGPVEKITPIDNTGELASTFGTPDETVAVDFLNVEYFLKYSRNARVVRVVGDSAENATAGDSAENVVVKNLEDYDTVKSTFSASNLDVGMWLAKYPGALGNSLGVSIFAVGDSDSAATTSAAFATWDYRLQFDGPPGTSSWASERNGSNDEVHVAVIDRLGQFSGVVGGVLEVFSYLSVAPGSKTADGGNNYIVDVLNNQSSYVWFGYFDTVRTVAGSNWGVAPDQINGTDYAVGVTWNNAASTDFLVQGNDGASLGTADYARGFDLYEDKESVEIDMLVAPGMSTSGDQVTVVNDLVAIANSRKDLVVVTSPDRAAVQSNTPVEDTITTADSFTASNYLIVDNNYFKVFDRYNNQYVNIPAASSTAGLMAATDFNYGPWYSPAGEKRGRYFGVTSLVYSPLKSERDDLYKAGVNPIVNFPGRGVLLFGDKTKESRPSAFDRINVRRLFLALEKSISIAARNVLFEFNDEFTRAEFVGVIEPALREVQARRGIQDFYVQCDETNNTAAVIDRNELVASIFIKPARSINFITLNFVAVRTGVEFDEVVGTV